MDKVQMKSEQITPFGGIFSIMGQFDLQIRIPNKSLNIFNQVNLMLFCK